LYIKSILLILLILGTVGNSYGQEISFKDTIIAYNNRRMKVNKVGMEVLCTWGIANIADGGIGYFTAKQDQWKYFHEMNALWGVVNTGIAALSLANGRKEREERLNAQQSYDVYKKSKRIYLVNAGLDLVYMATGVVLTKYGENTKSNAAIFTGFGKSIVIQGAFLFIFDNFMYTTHGRYDGKWRQIINEINVSSNGIGIRHNFK